MRLSVGKTDNNEMKNLHEFERKGDVSLTGFSSPTDTREDETEVADCVLDRIINVFLIITD